MKEVGRIYETTDYSVFKYLLGNRAVKPARVKKIKKSIIEVGYVNNPIVVNRKMEIIDGQGRFQALMELGLPIRYVIDENAGIKECRALNMGQTNWNTNDWINFYAENGNDNYIRFRAITEEFPDFTFDQMIGLVYNKIISSGYRSIILTNGELDFPSDVEKEVRDTCALLSPILDSLNKIIGSKRTKLTTVAWILRNTDCNKSRLLMIINDKYPLINPVPDSAELAFLNNLSTLYNKNLPKTKMIDFDSEYKKFLRQ
jgi:hypothetical protein